MNGNRLFLLRGGRGVSGLARRWLAVWLCLVPFAPLLAQNAGTVRGRVTDRDGVPLPGVTLTVRSQKNPSVNDLAALTDARGRFRIAGLPPGNDYAISASFPGMTTIIHQPIQVESGKVTAMDFTLLAEVVETIRVEAQGAIVDTTTATTSTTVNEAFISGLPLLGRNYTDLLTLAPGVTDTDGDGKPNVHGAREVDFQTRLSGVNITDPFGGEDTSQINIEAIEEVQLILTGANAEYGRAQGGVSSITTKGGGNEFEGSFKIFYQTRSLDGDGVHNQDAVVVDTGLPSFRTLKPFLTVGGAIRRDRAWYFLANQYIDQQEPINIIGVTRTRTIEGWNEYGKLTWQINPSHKVTLEALYDPRETTGNNIGIGISPISDINIKRSTPVFTVHETWVASPTILLDSTLSFLNGRQKVRPVFEPSTGTLPCPSLSAQLDAVTCGRIPDFTYTQKLVDGQTTGPWWVDQDSDSTRLTAKADLSFYIDDFLGNHQFKAGFEWVLEDYDTVVEQRPIRYDFQERIGRNTELVVFSDFKARVQEAEASGRSLGFYLQDSWRIRPNLTLNLGVRVEREILNAPGHTIFDPAAERAEFNALASQVYGNFDPNPLSWTEATGIFNLQPLPDGTLSCDITGDSECDRDDRIAISRVFTRHEAERAPSRYFTRLEETFNIPACGSGIRMGACRDDQEIDLKNTNLSPRVSITYDPFADGKTKLWASYGRFYDRLFLATIIPEQTRDFTYLTLQKPVDEEIFDFPAQRNFHIYQVSRDLRTPFVDEITIGFERELTPEFSVSVRYIRRKGRDQIQTRDINHFTLDENNDGMPDDNFGQADALGNPVIESDSFPDFFPVNPFFGGIFFLGNFNTSDYRGFEINLVKRLHRNWQFDASYTFSEAVGNAEAFESFFLGSDTSQVDLEFGHLDFDQRHVVKFSTVAQFPKRIQFGTRVTWESGLPFSLIRRGFTFDSLANPTFRQIFPTRQRNDQRNNGRWLIDVYLRKDLNIGNVVAGIDFTITNLLNSDDLEIGNINDSFRSFQLVDETQRRFGRRFQIGFTMNF